MKWMLLLTLTVLVTITFVACQSEPRHPLVLGDETPRVIYEPVEDLVTMIITDVGKYSLDVIIQNDSSWFICLHLNYAAVLDFHVDNLWLPLTCRRTIVGGVTCPQEIAPGGSRIGRFYLPNHNSENLSDSLPLEPGLYRVRERISIRHIRQDHDLVAEFYVTGNEE